jgi:ATPase subunit of ABC transporter with duplicated ATPase domains
MGIQITEVSSVWNPDAASIEGLDIKVCGKSLLEETNLKISVGDRVAILGRNGSGKTLLMTWLQQQGGAWSIYQVLQELPPTTDTVMSVVLSAHLERGRLWARQAELEAIEDMTDAELEEYTNVGDQLTAMKADADPPRVRRILAGLGFSQTEMDGPLSALSGGWRARVALARGLFMEPDLLLLDEPTNHLDLNGVLWLTEFLKEWRKTVIVISHNVGFVREVAGVIWLFRAGRVWTYRSRYDRFLKQRDLEERKMAVDWAVLDKQLVTLRKKGTPAARKEADALLLKRAGEGILRPEKPYRPKFFFVGDDGAERVGPLIHCDNATLGYTGRPDVLTHVTFALHDGCRVALVGANGSGKSTLVRFLAGDEVVVADGFVSRRPRLRVCAFDQHFYHTLPDAESPLEYLTQLAPEGADGKRVDVGLLRQVLGATGLPGEAHLRPIGTLSGGQKARVYFGGIAVQSPDVLLMDEPTNHLDMETIEGLTVALQEFRGAVVVVSHDLEFLEAVATETWIVREGLLVRAGEGTDGLTTYVDEVVATIEA